LCVAIRVIAAFLGLSISLQTIVHAPQDLGYLLMADRVIVRREFFREGPRALARPAQRGFRITAGQGFHQRFQGLGQRAIASGQFRPTGSRTTNTSGVQGLGLEFSDSLDDRDTRQAARPTNPGNAALSKTQGFARRHHTSRSFVEMGPDRRQLVSEINILVHAQRE